MTKPFRVTIILCTLFSLLLQGCSVLKGKEVYGTYLSDEFRPPSRFQNLEIRKDTLFFYHYHGGHSQYRDTLAKCVWTFDKKGQFIICNSYEFPEFLSISKYNSTFNYSTCRATDSLYVHISSPLLDNYSKDVKVTFGGVEDFDPYNQKEGFFFKHSKYVFGDEFFIEIRVTNPDGLFIERASYLNFSGYLDSPFVEGSNCISIEVPWLTRSLVNQYHLRDYYIKRVSRNTVLWQGEIFRRTK